MHGRASLPLRRIPPGDPVVCVPSHPDSFGRSLTLPAIAQFSQSARLVHPVALCIALKQILRLVFLELLLDNGKNRPVAPVVVIMDLVDFIFPLF